MGLVETEIRYKEQRTISAKDTWDMQARCVPGGD